MLPEKRWKQTREIKEHIKLIGPMVDSGEAMQWLHDRGFTIVRSGPYSDSAMRPRVDVSRFLFMAVRRVPKEGKREHVKE